MARENKAVFIGEFASDADAKTYINSTQFLREFGFKRATDVPFTGLFYRNTVTEAYRIWNGTQWDDLAGLGKTVAGITYVATNGDDTEGDGSILNPYATIAKGITMAGSGGSVSIGPGQYNETLAIVDSVNLEEMVKGTVTIQDTVVGGAVVTVTPPAGNIVVRISCNVVNDSNAGAGDIAVLLDNTGGVGSATVYFRGEVLDAGANGTAAQVDGDPGNTEQSQMILEGVEQLTGGINLALETPTDIFRTNDVTIDQGPAAFLNISGSAGETILANTLMAAAPNNEVIDFGLGGATGVNLRVGYSVFAATLQLNNIGGTGIAVITAGSEIARIGAAVGATNQRLQEWLGSDELVVSLLETPISAPATTTIFAPGAGRSFNPHASRTVNKAGPTGPATSISIDGTGPGSVVAPTGPGPYLPGVTNETVIVDSVVNPSTLDFTVVAPGLAGDFLDVKVTGQLF